MGAQHRWRTSWMPTWLVAIGLLVGGAAGCAGASDDGSRPDADATAADADGAGGDATVDADAAQADADAADVEADSGEDVGADDASADAAADVAVDATGDVAADATDDTATDAATDAAADAVSDATDADPDVATDTGADAGGGATLDAVLAALREDTEGTMLAMSDDGGWPAPIEGGWLFVTTDPGFTHVVGDFEGWTGLALTVDDGFRWAHAATLEPTGYKFRGDGDPVQDVWSRQYVDDAFGRLSLAGWTGPRLERWFDVDGAGRPGRTVRVWHPGVDWTHTLYVHDGQNVFDPTAIFGGWRLLDAVDDAPLLVVAIDNIGVDRMLEYTHGTDTIGGTTTGGLGAEYGAYVVDVVRPLIDAEYGEVGPVGTLGSSLGGLVSLNLALDDPGAWDFAASLSGTIGWGSIGADGDTILDRWASEGRVDVAVYLDSGGAGTCVDADGDGVNDDGESSDNYCENLQLRDLLDGLGYTFDETLWHWHEAGAPHNEAAWAARVWRPIEIFLAL